MMEHGDIVEQGSHEQLLAQRGAYYELYQSQFKGTDENEDAAEQEAAGGASVAEVETGADAGAAAGTDAGAPASVDSAEAAE